MEAQVSEILENILGLLALEGSFEVVEGTEEITVNIDASDPGRLIGFRGETLDSLQLIVNLILSKQVEEGEFKRVIIDVGGWRKNKEADLERRARNWAEEVKESGKELELEPMPSWQRRIVHMVAGEVDGVESESIGEGKERHLVIKPATVEEVQPEVDQPVVEKKTKAPKKKKEETKESEDNGESEKETTEEVENSEDIKEKD